jgi:hypothetical protein
VRCKRGEENTGKRKRGRKKRGKGIVYMTIPYLMPKLIILG